MHICDVIHPVNTVPCESIHTPLLFSNFMLQSIVFSTSIHFIHHNDKAQNTFVTTLQFY